MCQCYSSWTARDSCKFFNPEYFLGGRVFYIVLELRHYNAFAPCLKNLTIMLERHHFCAELHSFILFYFFYKNVNFLAEAEPELNVLIFLAI